MSGIVYLDGSSLVKLVIDEAETGALRSFVAGALRHATSRVGAIELERACLRRAGHDPERLHAVLEGIDIVEVDASIARRAAAVPPPTLRTLDAVHVATALELEAELDAFVTYDARQADAARLAGLTVISPA